MVEGKNSFQAPAIFSQEMVEKFHKKCNGFKDSNGGVAIPPCMGWQLTADENPFGTGGKERL
jgi:hypothetical protein